MLLDVGEDCVILHAKSGKYKLDIDLPFDVDNDSAGSQFNRKTKVRFLVHFLKNCLMRLDPRFCRPLQINGR